MGCWHVLCYVTLATRYLCCPFVKFPKVHWSRQQGIELPILSLNPDGVTTACSAGYTNDLATIFLRWILPFPSISPRVSPFPLCFASLSLASCHHPGSTTFFWSCSSPLVFQTMFSFFHHCCLPPLSFVARAAPPIARNGLTRLCRWYLERRNLFFVHRSCAINVKRPLVRSASLLCFWIEDGRIRGSLGIISELLTLMAVLNLWYRTERNFEFISSGLI